ncbi:MAG TPA: hypothetical protein VFX52_09335 [Nocardioidaceae bacterium]|nr:hypothetical protein [Nocardioidaceae bacterium]
MDLSGIIFVLLALVWAVFLIPKALRHSDEAARTRSIDRFSAATRVVARREPATGTDTQLVVPPPAARTAAPAPAPTAAAGHRPRTEVAPRRTAARVAARRRRRILGFLLLCMAGVVGGAAAGRLAWSWVAVPAVLVLAFLVLCRILVRREAARPVAERRSAAPAPQVRAPEADAVEVQAEVEVQSEERVDEQGVAEFDDAEDTMGLSVAALQAALGSPPAPRQGASSLWDPLPVTLPTYVTKAKARRTVRTIDLGEPGTWTSGRTVEDAEIAARATEPPAGDGDGRPEGGRRAVGS